MSESERLNAVIDNPELDQPRLAYATEVATSAPERAAFIQDQLELAVLRRNFRRGDRFADLYRREQVAVTRHGAAWSQPVAGLVRDVVFRRGFVEEVTIDAARFLERALELYGKAPILHLSVTGLKPVTTRFFASPHLGRLHSLSLRHNELGDLEALALADSDHLAKLTWLDLSYNAIEDAGLEALAASRRLPALQFLSFSGNRTLDPTPQLGGVEDNGMVHGMEYPERGQALEAKFGPRAWLRYATPVTDFYPPDRDAFDSQAL